MFVVILMALWPTLFTQTPPNDECFLSNSNAGPAEGHPLGFTFQGCDIWARIVWGARTSLAVGLLATVIGSTLGLIMGALAGFYGGWLDCVLSRVGDIFFAIPYILAAVVVMTVFSQNRTSADILPSPSAGSRGPRPRGSSAPRCSRVRQSDFVTPHGLSGSSRFRTLLSHVVPNSIGPLIVVSTLSLAAAIVAEATLSFLGVGLGSTSCRGATTSARRRPRCGWLRRRSSTRRSR